MSQAESVGVPTPPPGGWSPGVDPSRDLVLTPRRLRGVVHPIRLRLPQLMEADGPTTASQLGRRVGESSGTTSCHLRVQADRGSDGEPGTAPKGDDAERAAFSFQILPDEDAS